MFINIKKNWKKLDKYTKWAFYIILIAILVRFSLASISYITGDACGYVNIIRFMAENYKIPFYEPLGRPPLWQPPLFFIIASFFYKIFSIIGTNIAEFSIRLLSPFASILLLVYTFLLTRKLFNSKIAFYTVLFFSFIPNYIYYSSIPFVDVTVALFIVMSIYYILENKLILPSILMACALSTKYNALFTFPIPLLLLYIKYSKKRKLFFKKSLIYITIAGLLGSVWYIRNWVLLGSPVWPELSHITSSGSAFFSLLNIINPYSYLKLYLSFFGVPAGYYQNLFFIKLPFMNILLLIWAFATLIFIFPLFRGILSINLKNKRYKILLIWLIPFLLFLLLSIAGDLKTNFNILSKQVSEVLLSRYITPIFPVISLLWAVGFVSLFKNKKLRTIYLILFALIVSGFVSIEFTKSAVVKNSWRLYEKDFDFVRQNTEKNAKILVPFGPCYGSNFQRYTEEYCNKNYNYDGLKDASISYVWVNQYNTLYEFVPGKPAIYPTEFYDDIKKNYKMIYYNNKTKTEVYKVE